MSDILGLWPDDIGITQLRSPVEVLRQQASLLSQKTNGKVCAVVLPADPEKDGKVYAGDGAKIAYDFCLTAPSLGQNTYRIFTIIHGLELYPVQFTFERNALKLAVMCGGNPASEALIARDETELIYYFRKIFNSKIMKENVHGLLAQSRTVDMEEELC